MNRIPAARERRTAARTPLLAGLLVVLVVPAGAAGFARPAAAARAGSWSAGFAFERIHDDNVLQLSPQGFDRFASNSSPPRFLVASLDDDVNSLDGSARWESHLFPRRETRIEGTFEVHRYALDHVKNWQDYQLRWLQEITASRRTLARLRIWLGVRPTFYLGQFTDTDDSFLAGTRIRRSMTYRQSQWGIRWEQDVWRGRLHGELGIERRRRDYDSHFDERDNDNDQLRVQIAARPFPRWDLELGGEGLWGTLDARGDLPTSLIVDTDISYRHQGVGAFASVPWKTSIGRGHLDLDWMPELRRYTTTDKFDIARFGRRNHRQAVTVRAVQRVYGPFEATLRWHRLRSDAQFTSGINLPEDETDFDQTQLGVGLRARWRFPTR